MPRKPTLLLGISTFAIAAQFTPVYAQQAQMQGTAEREIHSREIKSNFAKEAIDQGNTALANKDYESAYAYFKSAVDALPNGGDATADLRSEAMSGFGTAVISLAKQRISEGRYEDAETTVKVILEEQYDPDYQPALKLLADLKTPGTFNPTLTPGFVANVELVKQLLREGDGFYMSGRYDLAFKRCEQVLNIDKYNIAARRLMEKINGARTQYADEAYNEARSDMITKVDAGWELPVTRFDAGSSSVLEQPAIDTRGTASIQRKLAEIRIPTIRFRETTVREALDFIKMQAARLDTTETDPAKKGINIVLKLDPANIAGGDVRITLELTDVSLGEALGFIANAANLKMKVEPYAVAIVPTSEQTDVLITKEYRVSPGFIGSLPAGDTAAAGAAGATGGFGFGGGAAPAAGAATAVKSGAKEFLEASGVKFPQGATANYLTGSGKLIVRNTQANLDLIDSLVENDNTTPTQVEIESKFVEISQNNLSELGFDWLLGQFQLPFGSGVYGGGGTSAFGSQITGTSSTSGNNGTITTNNAYPFQEPGQNGLPIGASSYNSGSLTGGNRSGSTAISVNALDGLLFGSPAGPAPGVMAIAGIFTNPQFQVVLRAMDQKKGIDLMTAPRVTAKSGQHATIAIVREFRYPTQFDPPQIPQTVNSGTFTPVTPTTPSSFEMRPLGIELEVEPTIGPDGFTIELVLSPRVTEFDGFINYGSPIYTSAQTVNQGIVDQVATGIAGGTTEVVGQILGEPTSVLVSDNVINQPVFSVRQVTTNVTIYDGQTVVLGGLMREDVQKVEDKTPIIGDIPLVGRLFRTSADQHIKRNLIMFVTANLIDAAGQPLQKAIENDEEVATPDSRAVESEVIPGDSLTAPAMPAPVAPVPPSL